MVTFQDAAGSWVLSYTNNGDLSSKAGTSQDYAFDYDLSSNLRSVQVNAATSASIAYAIDGLNRRVGRSVTPTMGASVSDGLLYDEQGRVVAELDGSNNVLSTFVYGLKPNVPDYMVRGGVAYRIVSDWRGDVRLVLDTTKTGPAAVVEQVDYDAWGNVTNLVDPRCSQGGTALCWVPFGFAGGVWDVTTGVVRFGARDYDPVARLWLQKDPIAFAGGQTNLYGYAAEDPVNQSDPQGLRTPTGPNAGWSTDIDPVAPPTQSPPPPPPPPLSCRYRCRLKGAQAYNECTQAGGVSSGCGGLPELCQGDELAAFDECMESCPSP